MTTARRSRERWIWLVAALVGFAIGLVIQNVVGFDEEQLSTMGDRRHLHGEESMVEGEWEEEEEENPKLYYTVATIVVLILISLTILFELTKEHLEESASRNMKPIIEKLFGEMTVLGFLSVCTFVVTKTGTFQTLGETIFGEQHEEELLEVFENAHFIIFFIMVLFVIQVLVLVHEAQSTEQEWLEMDKEARDADMHWTERASSYQRASSSFSIRSYTRLLPFCRNAKREHEEDTLLFKALRDEFILDRELDYPFRPAEERVDEDFNFGRYLGMCMGSLLTHVVDVRVSTWVFFAFATVVYYVYALLVKENDTVLAWSWVAIAWFTFFYNVRFERHLQALITAFASKELYEMSGLPPSNGETANLVEAASRLPDWCHVNLEQYLENRPIWTKCLAGGIPNRQQALYWMDRKGPPLYLFILQMDLLFIGIYVALQVVRFGPVMNDTLPLWGFILYIIVALAPMLFIVRNKKHLLSLLTPTCCLGFYRRPQMIANVIRQEKTAQAIRTFIIIYKLRRFATAAPEPTQQLGLHYSQLFDKFEIKEVGRTFDEFDLDGNGNITADEFQKLMSNMGATLTDAQMTNLVQKLDTDGNGGVSKDEFLQWYAEHCHDDDYGEEDFAKFMFRIFDDDDSGEITIGEFKKKLEVRTTRFTIDEIGSLVNELDENNGGSICVEEFEHLIHRYYPRELHSASSSSHHE